MSEQQIEQQEQTKLGATGATIKLKDIVVDKSTVSLEPNWYVVNQLEKAVYADGEKIQGKSKTRLNLIQKSIYDGFANMAKTAGINLSTMLSGYQPIQAQFYIENQIDPRMNHEMFLTDNLEGTFITLEDFDVRLGFTSKGNGGSYDHLILVVRQFNTLQA